MRTWDNYSKCSGKKLIIIMELKDNSAQEFLIFLIKTQQEKQKYWKHNTGQISESKGGSEIAVWKISQYTRKIWYRTSNISHITIRLFNIKDKELFQAFLRKSKKIEIKTKTKGLPTSSHQLPNAREQYGTVYRGKELWPRIFSSCQFSFMYKGKRRAR